MTPEQQTKLDNLRKAVASTGGCAVAFSGGVDSSLLLTVAAEQLGEKVLAVIATSSTYPKRELECALEFLRDRGIRYVVVESEELDIPGFADNPPDRCYHCKKELFGKLWARAKAEGFDCILDGANADDTGDFRPGMRAAREMRVLSPLLECGLTKPDIRAISREVYGLSTADKQPMACLSSRFPYGSKITREKLRQVEAVEDFLYEKGFSVFRARHHGDTVRLELAGSELQKLWSGNIREEIVSLAKSLGFAYVTVDLEGFRSGSMNEVLDGSRRGQ
jgi:pyridinium-3,5-biscarboxylic acid mononucleotide sulfurtransferase